MASMQSRICLRQLLPPLVVRFCPAAGAVPGAADSAAGFPPASGMLEMLRDPKMQVGIGARMFPALLSYFAGNVARAKGASIRVFKVLQGPKSRAGPPSYYSWNCTGSTRHAAGGCPTLKVRV